MAKLALLFIAIFCLVQFSLCASVEVREKRDAEEAVEPTTPSILDMLQDGIKKAFSEDNINKMKSDLEYLGGKLKTFGDKAVEGVKNALKKDDEKPADAA